MLTRVANSLTIIVFPAESENGTVGRTRLHLQDAHKRVMSIATVQEHLHGYWRQAPPSR